MCNFAEKPATINSRYDPIFASCQRGRLQVKEMEQYFRAMVTEREQQGIAAFYKEEGLREGFEMGKAEGKAEGIAEGITKGMERTAKAMKKNGLSMDVIVACTGLSKESIEKL